MGPTLFLLYVNKFPEVIKKRTCEDDIHTNSHNLFSKNCKRCGTMIIYADDSTYVTSARTHEENQIRLAESLEDIKVYLNTNKLCINESKMCLIESMNCQKRSKTQGDPPFLLVRDENAVLVEKDAEKEARLLGVNISDNLTWRAHLSTGEKALFPGLRKQLGMLKFLSRNISKAGRKTLAEGLILSRIQYTLPLWGGTSKSNHKKLQVLINKAAQIVTGRGKRASTRSLMEECNWLTGREMTQYMMLTEMWKNLNRQEPENLAGKFSWEEDWRVSVTPARLVLSRNSYRWRACSQWNLLCEELRSCQSLPVFKKKTRAWIKEQRVPLDDPLPPTQQDVPPHPPQQDVPLPPTQQDVPLPPPQLDVPTQQDVPLPLPQLDVPSTQQDVPLSPPQRDAPLDGPSTQQDVPPPPTQQDGPLPPTQQDVPPPQLDVPLPPPQQDGSLPPTQQDVPPTTPQQGIPRHPTQQDVPLPPAQQDIPLHPPQLDTSLPPTMTR